MKRLFAYRPLLFGALYICLGLLIGYFIYADKMLELIIALALSSILPIILIVNQFVLRPIPNKLSASATKFYFFTAKHNRLYIVLSLCVVLGFSLFNIGVSSFEDNRIQSASGYMSGTITKSIVDKQNYLSFYMRDCTIYLPNGTAEKLDGLIQVYSTITAGDLPKEINLGNRIAFDTTVFAQPLLKDNGDLDSFSYKFNIKYACTLIESAKDSIVVGDGQATFAESVNVYVLNMLLDSMDRENALLAWSVLFGDSTQLNSDVIEAFKISGVMHIIAVSGMNVVFIVAIILGFLRLINVRNRKIQFLINCVVLVLYCWLCAFTPSVVRASIMSLVFLFARMMGYKGDLLSNISASAMIILFIQPLMLFEPGFLLSFGSLIGIILINAPIYRVLRMLHIPKVLAFSISSTTSAQLGIYPILALYFGYLSTYSFIANIIIVPIFEFAYIILFVLVIATAILPALSACFPILEIAFSFINWFPTLFVDLPHSVILVFRIGIFVVAYYLLLMFLSQFIFLSKRSKAVTCSILALIFAVGAVGTYFSKNDNYEILSTHGGSSTLIFTPSNTLLVGAGSNYRDVASISNDLYALKVLGLDTAVLWQGASESKTNLYNFTILSTKYNARNIIVGPEYASDFAVIDWLEKQDVAYLILPFSQSVRAGEFTYFIYGTDTALSLIIIYDNIAYIFYKTKKNYNALSSQMQNKAKSLNGKYCYEFYSSTVVKTIIRN